VRGDAAVDEVGGAVHRVGRCGDHAVPVGVDQVPVDPGAARDPGQAELAHGDGDVLVAATDGFNEAFAPDGEMFGYDRLLATVHDLASRSAEEIGQGLFAAVEAYSQGRPQDDDQTVVVLKGAPA